MRTQPLAQACQADSATLWDENAMKAKHLDAPASSRMMLAEQGAVMLAEANAVFKSSSVAQRGKYARSSVRFALPHADFVFFFALQWLPDGPCAGLC
mmetsp:Transcript_47670/g.94752  ORF Transcript_47670/g.94752 Transcript_47670/m.94752 type:complete len:97 (-) Transcript_47670:471-761(-)